VFSVTDRPVLNAQHCLIGRSQATLVRSRDIGLRLIWWLADPAKAVACHEFCDMVRNMGNTRLGEGLVT